MEMEFRAGGGSHFTFMNPFHKIANCVLMTASVCGPLPVEHHVTTHWYTTFTNLIICESMPSQSEL
jgi:hypothetical protein